MRRDFKTKKQISLGFFHRGTANEFVEKMRIQLKYIVQNLSNASSNTLFTGLLNIACAFQKPKGITAY